jgi:hypothetical protein
MRRSEPPCTGSRARSPLFFIGRNSHGTWVVQDEDCRRGGLFVNRAEALKFALFENDHQPRAVVMVPGVFELDMNRTTSPLRDYRGKPEAPGRRRAA